MACNTLSAFALGCKDNSGGIREVYIGKFEKNQTYVLGTSSNTDMIESFTGTTASFHFFEQSRDTASATDNGEGNIQNHTTTFTPTLTITVPKMTAALQSAVKTLIQGKWRIIYLDNNGRYFYLGDKNGLDVLTSNGGAGQTMDSLNGYTITFEGKEQNPAIEVTLAAALQLITT